MDARRFVVAQRVDVVEGAGDRAVAEQHHPIGDADRDDVEIAGGAERLAIDVLAGQDAERAGAVAEHRIDRGRRPVRGIVRPVVIDEIAGQALVQESRLGGVIVVVAGIEMGDTNHVAGRRRGIGRSDARARFFELRMGFVDEPQVGIAGGVDVVIGRRRIAAGNSRAPGGLDSSTASVCSRSGSANTTPPPATPSPWSRSAWQASQGLRWVSVSATCQAGAAAIIVPAGRSMLGISGVSLRSTGALPSVKRAGRRGPIGLDQKPQSPLDHGRPSSRTRTRPPSDAIAGHASILP